MYRALVVLICLIFHPLFARPSIEVRADLFVPSSERFRSIYGNVGRNQELEISSSIFDSPIGWVNFDWLSKYGKSIGFGDPTRITIANVSLGMKFPYPLSNELIPYFGFGQSLGRIRILNESLCGDEDLTKIALGGVVKIGVYFFFNRILFTDLFVDYLFQPARFETTVNVGGFKTGLGIGFQL